MKKYLGALWPKAKIEHIYEFGREKKPVSLSGVDIIRDDSAVIEKEIYGSCSHNKFWKYIHKLANDEIVQRGRHISSSPSMLASWDDWVQIYHDNQTVGHIEDVDGLMKVLFDDIRFMP